MLKPIKMPTTSATPASPAWHALAGPATLDAVSASRDGLTQTEAASRLERFGANLLPPPKRRSPLTRFLLQFHNVLIYVLLGAGLITALLGHLAVPAT